MSKVTLAPAPPSGGQVEPERAVEPPVRPVGVGTPGMRPLDTTVVYGQVGSIDSVRSEVDDACRDMETFLNQEPDAVMRLCSGHSARLSTLRTLIFRIEDVHRQWRPIRTNEIEPTISELANQYQIASRLLSARELDWKIETGGRAGP